MSLTATVKDAVKAAMRAKEKERLSALRLITAEFKKVEVDERIEVDDARALQILDKMCRFNFHLFVSRSKFSCRRTF